MNLHKTNIVEKDFLSTLDFEVGFTLSEIEGKLMQLRVLLPQQYPLPPSDDSQ